MASVREQILFDKWKELNKKKLISINDVEDLMDAVDKILMEIKRVTESRDKWRMQVKDLKSQLREFKDIR